MRWIALISALALSACGPLSQGNPTLGLAQGLVSGGGDDSSGPGLFDVLDRDFIEAQANEIMLVSVISRETAAVVVRAGNNGPKVTWLSQDGIGVTFERGILISTRGLGADLMAADVSSVTGGFSSASNYMRTHDYLNGLDQIESLSFSCSIAFDKTDSVTIFDIEYQTRLFIETCEGGDVRFENYYWRDASGVIWQSRQWISEDVGYLGYQRL